MVWLLLAPVGAVIVFAVLWSLAHAGVYPDDEGYDDPYDPWN